MKSVNITLTFDGQTEEAFNFYKSVFGGDFMHIQRIKEIPGAPPVSAEEGERILHMALPVGPNVLMGMDVPAYRMVVNKGNNFMVTIDTGSEEETNKFFTGLSKGAEITMPLARQFWGAYFGMLTDKFGIQWMISNMTE